MSKVSGAVLAEKLDREFGPELRKLYAYPQLRELAVNPDGRVWIENGGNAMEPTEVVVDPVRREQITSTLAVIQDEVLDERTPTIGGEMPDGSRFQVWIPPVVTGPAFTIRKHLERSVVLDAYVEQGAMTAEAAEKLRAAVRERKNVLVAGGTGSGKTTLLQSLLREVSLIDAEHRVFVIEDTKELKPENENFVSLRTSRSESMVSLVRTTMRGRPDRIIVGEIRDGETALELCKAWNTGHPGGLATIHAGGALAALHRLEELLMECTQGDMRPLIGRSVQLVVSIQRDDENSCGRRIGQMLEVVGWDREGGVWITALTEL